MTVGYGGIPLIRQIGIHVRPGEIVTLIGPNGAGKSTILRSVIRQLGLLEGAVYLDGTPMQQMGEREIAKRMSILMTERIHPELMTCEDVVSTGRYPYTGRMGILTAEDRKKVREAMELVASSKLRHAKERVIKSRPYFNTMYETMARIAKETREGDSVFTKVRTVKKSLFIVIAGDRGLAGGYNSNVLKLAAAQMADKRPCVITMGKKAQEYYAKRDFEVLADYPDIAETMRIQDTHDIVDDMLYRFKKGEIDEAYICYTEFVSPMTQEARCQKLLPLSFADESAEKGKPKALTEYDPSPEAVFSSIVPEYLNGVLYGAVVESYASEQSARRMAMESASDNASEMIENLNLSYNRARQAAITQEITEIVAGSGQVGS